MKGSGAPKIERVKAQHELIAIRKAYVVAEYSLSGTILTTNGNFQILFGYRLEELEGKPHSILVPAEQAASPEYKRFWESLKAGQFQTGDFLHVDKHGREIWVTGSYSPILDSNGKPFKILEYAQDITQRKLIDIAKARRTEEVEKNLKVANLAVLNQKLALDSAAIVAETDKKGRITYVNQNFEELSKYTSDELIGQDHRLLNSGFHSKDFFSSLWKTISKGNVWHGEIKNKAKDGSFYWVDTTIYPVKDERNFPRSFIAIKFDITGKKEALEKLELAKERAIVAEQMKSDFLYTMSHEIRTPLNAIIGMIGLLQETDLSPDQAEFSEAIVKSGKALISIINDILDFSKIEVGKMELEETEFDLSGYLTDLFKTFQITSTNRNVKLTLECPAYPYYVRGDDGRIGQVISNLMSNALKFTKEGEIVLSADPVHRGDMTDVVLTIQDTGIGIREEAKALLFRAFSQAEKSISRNFGGTGLGLSISKRLVELMGGRIGFESQFGKGTTFKVELPMKTGRPIERSHTQNVKPIRKVERSKANPIHGRILVAEDNSTNQLVISRMLDRWQCKYMVVSNGKEVLEALEKAEFDLILMDCQMPEMDGYTASRMIRESDFPSKGVPIVALTANAIQEEGRKCRAAGMNDYLTKPVYLAALEEVLRKYLDPETKAVKQKMINRATLDEFSKLQQEGDPPIVPAIIDSFLRGSEARLDTITGFVESGDVDAVRREAHSLKSGALTVGAELVGQICQRLEELKSNGSAALLVDLHSSLVSAYRQSCEELAEIKRSLESEATKSVSKARNKSAA